MENDQKLSNPKKTIEIIQKYNFNFQKKFGQNFLIDSHVLNKIIAGAQVTKEDMVLEIGPGIGTMTQYLAEAARQVVAVEIDRNLIPVLKETLGDYDNVTVINEDILKLDLAGLADAYNGGKPIKVVATLDRVLLQRPSSWGCLRAMSLWIMLRSWCRRKWQSVWKPAGQQGLRRPFCGCPVLCPALYCGQCSM